MSINFLCRYSTTCIFSLIDKAFGMIDQWIFGESIIFGFNRLRLIKLNLATANTTSFLSDLTKLTSSVDKTKLNCIGVHLILAIAMIAEYVGRESMSEIFGLMEILKYHEEKVVSRFFFRSNLVDLDTCIVLKMLTLKNAFGLHYANKGYFTILGAKYKTIN